MARLSLDIASAQTGNNRMQNVAETKLLNFNLEKSCFMVFGNYRRRSEIMHELESNPLLLNGQPMVNETVTKYLGDLSQRDGSIGISRCDCYEAIRIS